MVAGWSVVTEQYSQAPLQLHRPLYLDAEIYPTVFLKTPSAGLLGGDKHSLSVHALENSTIKILNQCDDGPVRLNLANELQANCRQ